MSPTAPSRRLAHLLTAALLTGLLPVAAAPTASAATTVTRLAGDDRYATAVAVSKAAYPAGGVPVVHIATGDNFPDALAGGAAAAYGKGPLLLVTADTIPAVVATELGRLKPGRIVIHGGTDVVTDTVATALKTYTAGAITRDAGADRYATALATSKNTFPDGYGGSVIIATGENYPDALAAGSLLADHLGPILLADPTGGLNAPLSSDLKTEITRLKPRKVFILGGEDVVTRAVETDVRALGYPVDRFPGRDRYETAELAAVTDFPYTYPNVRPTEVLVATGTNFPDGLAAGPLAAIRNAPIVLTSGTCWDGETLQYLRELNPAKLTFLGGPDVVSDALTGMRECAPVVLDVGPVGSTYVGGRRITITGMNLTSSTKVTFDGVPGTDLVVWSSAALEVTTPAHATGTVTVEVTNEGGTGTGPRPFWYVDSMTGKGPVPYSGPASGGGTYMLSGSGLSGVESVTFGGVEAPNLYALDDTGLGVWVPAHDPGEVRIVLHMPGAPDVDAGPYTYLPD